MRKADKMQAALSDTSSHPPISTSLDFFRHPEAAAEDVWRYLPAVESVVWETITLESI
jgi:hypothetical protein